MLADVGEGLLRHPEERRLHLRRQALVPQLLLVVNLAAFVADLLDLQSDGGAETEVVESGGPQVGYDVAGLSDRLLDELEYPGEVPEALLGCRLVAPGEGLQKLVGRGGAFTRLVTTQQAGIESA